jgi:putative hemolysin
MTKSANDPMKDDRPQMRGFQNFQLTRLLLRLMRINRFKDLKASASGKTEIEFIGELFEKLEISCEASDEDLCRIPRTGPFIVVANHPFGGLDDLILLKIFSRIRPDFRIFANPILKKFGGLDEFFLPGGTPFSSIVGTKTSSTHLQAIMAHLQNGGSLGIFPSGTTSGYDLSSNNITDKQWKRSILMFIRNSGVPIVPVYFHGSNSLFFHVLGFIHPLLQTFKLPSEFLNKKKHKIEVRIGTSIPLKDQQEFHEISRFGRYLRARTYALGTSLEVKKFYAASPAPSQVVEEIIPPVPVGELEAEINNLDQEYHLFDLHPFRVYSAPVSAIPLAINEIGRLREFTFRQVGEGTNQKIDLDEYDIYYRHLFIWDYEARKIVGAYRIGMGAEIVKEYGVKGFYIHSLYRITDGFYPVMNTAIELGRSFIVAEYQRKPLSLYCLWKGILYFLLKHPEYRYLIGPVSISNRFSHFSRSLMIEYIMQHHYNQELARFVAPRNAFKPNTGGVDVEILLEGSRDLRKFDKQIRDVNLEDMGLPVLLKKYLGLNGKIVAFNLDPLFNDALDGLLVLDLMEIPMQVIVSLSKEISDDSILERFKMDTPTSTNEGPTA